MNLLVGDIGGTHTRLAVYDGSSLHPPHVFDNDVYEDIRTLQDSCLHGIPPERWQSTFRFVFVRKGNWTEYPEAIPTWLVTDPFATLRGLIAAGGG